MVKTVEAVGVMHKEILSAQERAGLKFEDLGVVMAGTYMTCMDFDGDDHIYFTTDSGRLGKYCISTKIFTDLGQPFPTTNRIEAICWDGNDDMYFGQEVEGRIGRIAVATDTITDMGVPIAGETYVMGLAYDQTNNRIYFTTAMNCKHGRIDCVTNVITDLGVLVAGEIVAIGVTAIRSWPTYIYFGTGNHMHIAYLNTDTDVVTDLGSQYTSGESAIAASDGWDIVLFGTNKDKLSLMKVEHSTQKVTHFGVKEGNSRGVEPMAYNKMKNRFFFATSPDGELCVFDGRGFARIGKMGYDNRDVIESMTMVLGKLYISLNVSNKMGRITWYE